MLTPYGEEHMGASIESCVGQLGGSTDGKERQHESALVGRQGRVAESAPV